MPSPARKQNARKVGGKKAPTNDKAGKNQQKQSQPANSTVPREPMRQDPVFYRQHTTVQPAEDAFSGLLRRRVQHLSEALDTSTSGRFDSRQLGALLCAVGCCPTESQLRELLARLHEADREQEERQEEQEQERRQEEEEGRRQEESGEGVSVASALPLVVQCVEDRCYRPSSGEELHRALLTLAHSQDQEPGAGATAGLGQRLAAGAGDKPGRSRGDTGSAAGSAAGVLTQARLVRLLTEEGEHFSQEEVEEMMSAVPVDSETGGVDMDQYVRMLVVPEMW